MPPDALPFSDLSKVFPSATKPKPIQMQGSGGLKPRVLIADNDPVYTLTVFHFLVQAGYEVLVTEQGADAIAELRKADHPRVAILNSRLSGMEGIEICERMRDAEKNVYLMLTGDNPTTHEIVIAMERGADLLLSKSLPPEELLAHIKVGLRTTARHRVLIEKIEELMGMRPTP
jgi:DNA-binding response OmpR family regulator